MKKKSLIIALLTICIEGLLFFGVTAMLDWSYIDVSSIGGILVFGVIWMIKFNSYQVVNTANPYERVWATTEKERQPFQFNLGPFRTGLLIYALISFGTAVIVYLPYFFG